MVLSNKTSYQLGAVFLYALHKDVPPLDADPDGIETADLSHSFWQRTPPFNGFGYSKVLQLVIDEGDVVVF